MSDRKDDFSLLEALLWAPDEGYFLLDSHLDRLAGSAGFFHRLLDIERVRDRLEELGAELCLPRSYRLTKSLCIAVRSGAGAPPRKRVVAA